MKNEDLFESINDIDEEYIITADNYRNIKKYSVIRKWVTTAAGLLLVAGVTVAVIRISPDKNPARGESTANNTPEYSAADGLAYGDFDAEEIADESDAAEEIANVISNQLSTGTISYEADSSQMYSSETDLKEDNLNSVFNYDVLSVVDFETGDETAEITYLNLWGGVYVDEFGTRVVMITEDTPEYRQLIFDRYPNLNPNSVIFKEVNYPLYYLEYATDYIEDLYILEDIPGMISCYLVEEDNCVEIHFYTDFEESAESIVSMFPEGMIRVVYE